jgi:hypothetical protein
MGGSSKSSTQNTTNIDSSTRNFNQAGSQAAVAGSFNRVTVSDQGSIEKAFDFGGEALARAFEFGSASTDGAFNLSRDVVNSASADRRESLNQSVRLAEGARASADQQINKAFQFAQSAAQPANLEPYIIPGAIAATVIGVALIMRGAK